MADISILISIIAILVSVISVILVAMKEGIALSLGFRESSETASKRQSIQTSLETEVNKSILSFLEKNKDKVNLNQVDDDMKDNIFEIAIGSRYSNFGNRILERMTRTLTLFLEQLTMAIIFTSILAIYAYLYYPFGISDVVMSSVGLLVYFLPFSIFFYFAFNTSRRYFRLRLAFQRLSEKPTIEICNKIDDWLEEKGIHM